jgi:hypothetical protein
LRGIRGDVVWEVVKVAADELSPKASKVALLEFFVGFVDGFEERVGDTGEGGGVFGIDTAFGEGVKEASERVGEGGSGYEVAGDGFYKFGGGGVGLAKMAELALVMVAVFGVGERTRKAAATSIREGKGTQRRAVFGGIGRHGLLHQVKLD